MKKIPFAVIFSIVLGLAAFIPAGNKPIFTPVPVPDTTLTTTDQGIDVLKQVKAMNADKMPTPPTHFNAGHVSFTDINDYLKKTKDGFVIKLPSNTNVPTPSVHDGKVYVSGGFGSKQYFAFNSKTGEKEWAVNIDDDGPSSGVIENDVLVYNTESCTIFATDAKTGKYLWSHFLGDPLMSMPAVANGKVFTAYPCYANSGFNEEVKENGKLAYNMKSSHVLIAMDLKTGNIVWQKWIDGDVMSAPVADGENLYITSFPGTVYKFNQKDGEILSAKYMRATSAPIIKDGEMTVSRRSDRDGNAMESIAQVNEENMTVTKQFAKKEAQYLSKNVQAKSQLKTTSMSYDAGNGFAGGAPSSSGAYIAEENIGQSNVSSLQSFQGSRILSYKGKNYNTMGDEIVCTDKEGKTTWSSKLSGDMHSVGGFLGTPPLAVGGKIIVATYNGDIQIMDAESGKVETTYTTGENIRYQPVVEEGWIYVTTTSGKLIAINTEKPELTGWPMWGGNAQHTNIVQ